MPQEEESPSAINCPYCGAGNPLENEFCAACYKHLQVPAEVRAAAKAERIMATASGRPAPRGVPAFSRGASLQQPAAAETVESASYRLWLRLALMAALAFWYSRWLVNDNYFSFLDGVNLAFHEAGHLFLGWAGEFIGFLGGTIFQLLGPAVCLFHLKRRGANLAWHLCLFWIGESLLNISIYAGDAQKQALPLVGGGEHDWAYILAKTGLLAHTFAVSGVIFLAGTGVIAWSLYLIWQDALAKAPIELGDKNAGGFW